jgi:uncharacterized protein (DUF1697 family)
MILYKGNIMVNTYITFFRGINVGGKNKVIMSELKNCIEELGFSNVKTYIASGNVIFDSDKKHEEIKPLIENVLPEKFKLDDELIKVLVLSREQFQAVITNKPVGFGEQPKMYHSDALFLMDVESKEAMAEFNPKEGVDVIWAGDGVIYSQRLSSQRTKSRLNKIMSSPVYKSMTIRSWNTVAKLLELL